MRINFVSHQGDSTKTIVTVNSKSNNSDSNNAASVSENNQNS